jgi:two-component system sensor histidine kinase KdpD
VGLALCSAIAQAHGGTLRYRARAHGGASFECVLPLPAAPASPPVPAAIDGAAR